jgi:hypothetical protein
MASHSYRFLLTLALLSSALPALSQNSLEARVQELKWESLLDAYPESVKVVNAEKKIFRVHDSRSYYFDDGSGPKSPEDRLLSPDPEDTFFDVYPLDCSNTWKPAKDFDPGRYRDQSFLEELYGRSKDEIENNLVHIPWVYLQILRVTRREHVDERFRKIVDYFQTPERKDFQKYLWPSEGVYNYRPVAGTRQLSSHSFGAAIDLNLKYSNYWKWENPDSNGELRYVNKMPCEVIEGFESFGFITGAKWYHYYTMHFEYRPELILFARKLRKEFGNSLEALKNLSTIRIH